MNSSTGMPRKEQKAVFQSIVEAVSRTMNLPACIWVLDEEAQALRIGAAVGLKHRSLVSFIYSSISSLSFAIGPLVVRLST